MTLIRKIVGRSSAKVGGSTVSNSPDWWIHSHLHPGFHFVKEAPRSFILNIRVFIILGWWGTRMPEHVLPWVHLLIMMQWRILSVMSLVLSWFYWTYYRAFLPSSYRDLPWSYRDLPWSEVIAHQTPLCMIMQPNAKLWCCLVGILSMIGMRMLYW